MIDWICSENLLMMSRKFVDDHEKVFTKFVFDVDDVVVKVC
jgi:hypothetical protein